PGSGYSATFCLGVSSISSVAIHRTRRHFREVCWAMWAAPRLLREFQTAPWTPPSLPIRTSVPDLLRASSPAPRRSPADGFLLFRPNGRNALIRKLRNYWRDIVA